MIFSISIIIFSLVILISRTLNIIMEDWVELKVWFTYEKNAHEAYYCSDQECEYECIKDVCIVEAPLGIDYYDHAIIEEYVRELKSYDKDDLDWGSRYCSGTKQNGLYPHEDRLTINKIEFNDG